MAFKQRSGRCKIRWLSGSSSGAGCNGNAAVRPFWGCDGREELFRESLMMLPAVPLQRGSPQVWDTGSCPGLWCRERRRTGADHRVTVAESQHDSGKMGVSANVVWARGYCPFKENRPEWVHQHGSLCATRRTGRFLFVPAVSTYNKPYLTFEQQLELLKKRGMEIAAGAEPAVLAGLRRIGYYRLSAYWYPLRKTDESQDSSVRRLDDFRHGATFGQVLGLYEFDKRLRLLVLDANAGVPGQLGLSRLLTTTTG